MRDHINIDIKICGVRDPENIAQICAINPQYIGFDFRPNSKRFIGEIDQALLSKIDHTIRKVGIFDTQPPLYISYIAGRFSLNSVQIEGDVAAQTCEILAAEGLEIIKVIQSLSDIDKYEGICNKFLVRDSNILSHYHSKTKRSLIVDWKLYDSNIDAIVDVYDDFESKLALKEVDKIENWIKNRVQ